MVSLNRPLTEKEANILKAKLLVAKHPSERFIILLGLARHDEGLTEFNSSMKELHNTFYSISRSHPKAFRGIGFDTRTSPWSIDLERWLGMSWFSGLVRLDMLSNQVLLNPELWPKAESLLAVKYDSKEEEQEFRAAAHELAEILKPRK